MKYIKKKLKVKNDLLNKIELNDKSLLLIDDIEEIQKSFKFLWTYIKLLLEEKIFRTSFYK